MFLWQEYRYYLLRQLLFAVLRTVQRPFMWTVRSEIMRTMTELHGRRRSRRSRTVWIMPKRTMSFLSLRDGMTRAARPLIKMATGWSLQTASASRSGLPSVPWMGAQHATALSSWDAMPQIRRIPMVWAWDLMRCVASGSILQTRHMVRWSRALLSSTVLHTITTTITVHIVRAAARTSARLLQIRPRPLILLTA